jgi:UDP-GlcNAc:undecaprenyl-phosphate GlcNAc-1-phosphate transferase
MYTWTFLFAFTVVGLSIEGVPLVLFPLTVLLAVGVLVMMSLPRWRARREANVGGGNGAHTAGRRSRHNAVPAQSPPLPPEAPGPRPAAADGDTAMLSALPDLSLTAPRQTFSNPETRR